MTTQWSDLEEPDDLCAIRTCAGGALGQGLDSPFCEKHDAAIQAMVSIKYAPMLMAARDVLHAWLNVPEDHKAADEIMDGMLGELRDALAEVE